MRIKLSSVPRRTVYSIEGYDHEMNRFVEFCALKGNSTYKSFSGCKEDATYRVTQSKSARVIIATPKTKLTLQKARQIRSAVRKAEKLYGVTPSCEIVKVNEKNDMWCVKFSKIWIKNRITLSLLMTHIRLEFHKKLLWSQREDKKQLEDADKIISAVKKNGIKILSSKKISHSSMASSSYWDNSERKGIVDLSNDLKDALETLEEFNVPAELLLQAYQE